ncbi:hypothetical protein [Clostridium sp. UBA7339]|uniref:hypothetical protein n=1 Tax=Clostridium sp. UBA7339 TaxID=1946376 RepID=UPI003217E623
MNDKERCLEFTQKKEYLIVSEDTYWLGFGMYFWDNRSNAKYWMHIKRNQNPDKEYIGVRANIFIYEDILLDLTDESTVEKIEEIWDMYCKLNKEKQSQPLGIKLDKLFDFLEEWDDLNVIKGIGDYNINQNKSDSLRLSNNYKGPQIRGGLKVIYCVRQPDIAINRDVIGVD